MDQEMEAPIDDIEVVFMEEEERLGDASTQTNNPQLC